MSLSQVSRGRKVTIVSLDMENESCGRLMSMGLVPGTHVYVIDNSRTDVSLVECRGTRLALGRGLSHFIQVAE